KLAYAGALFKQINHDLIRSDQRGIEFLFIFAISSYRRDESPTRHILTFQEVFFRRRASDADVALSDRCRQIIDRSDFNIEFSREFIRETSSLALIDIPRICPRKIAYLCDCPERYPALIPTTTDSRNMRISSSEILCCDAGRRARSNYCNLHRVHQCEWVTVLAIAEHYDSLDERQSEAPHVLRKVRVGLRGEVCSAQFQHTGFDVKP